MNNMICGLTGYICGFISSFILLISIKYIANKKKKTKTNLKINSEEEAESYIYSEYGYMLINNAKSYYNTFYNVEQKDNDAWRNDIKEYLSNLLINDLNKNNIEFSDEELEYISDEVLDKVFCRVIDNSCIFTNNNRLQNMEKIKNNNELNNSNQSNSVNISSALIDFYKE